MTISRCIALRLQPRATISAASQSSSSGCDGRPPLKPKSLGVSTRPVPKCACQSRLTMTRANSGIARAGDPGGQAFPALGLGASAARPKSASEPGDRRDPAGRDDVAGLLGIAPDLEMRRRRPRGRRRRRPVRFAPVDDRSRSISSTSRSRSARMLGGQGGGDRRRVDVVAERAGRGGDLRGGREPGRRPGPARWCRPASGCRRPARAAGRRQPGLAGRNRDRPARLVRRAVGPAVAEERIVPSSA